MKFSNREEREKLIKSFDSKAEDLTLSMLKSKEIPAGTKVLVETITNWEFEIPVGKEAPEDAVEEIKGIGKNPVSKTISNPGEIYVAYIRQPQLINAGQIYDRLFKSGKFEAGLYAFDSMVLLKHSSPEVENYDIKLGLAWRLAEFISVKLPDHKKK